MIEQIGGMGGGSTASVVALKEPLYRDRDSRPDVSVAARDRPASDHVSFISAQVYFLGTMRSSAGCLGLVAYGPILDTNRIGAARRAHQGSDTAPPGKVPYRRSERSPRSHRLLRASSGIERTVLLRPACGRTSKGHLGLHPKTVDGARGHFDPCSSVRSITGQPAGTWCHRSQAQPTLPSRGSMRLP